MLRLVGPAAAAFLLTVAPWVLAHSVAKAAWSEKRAVERAIRVTVVGVIEKLYLWVPAKQDIARGLVWVRPWGVFALTAQTRLPEVPITPGDQVELTYELYSRTALTVTVRQSTSAWASFSYS